jgi:putative addiction module component (TIGR02574 family)
MVNNQDFPYHELSIEERMLLVEDIWDSIAAEREAAPLTEAQHAELKRRQAVYEANPQDAISWQQVIDRINALRQARGR